jgi:DNA repair exonuclease SbcCD ATPase subunit
MNTMTPKNADACNEKAIGELPNLRFVALQMHGLAEQIASVEAHDNRMREGLRMDVAKRDSEIGQLKDQIVVMAQHLTAPMYVVGIDPSKELRDEIEAPIKAKLNDALTEVEMLRGIRTGLERHRDTLLQKLEASELRLARLVSTVCNPPLVNPNPVLQARHDELAEELRVMKANYSGQGRKIAELLKEIDRLKVGKAQAQIDYQNAKAHLGEANLKLQDAQVQDVLMREDLAQRDSDLVITHAKLKEVERSARELNQLANAIVIERDTFAKACSEKAEVIANLQQRLDLALAELRRRANVIGGGYGDDFAEVEPKPADVVEATGFERPTGDDDVVMP